jgi:hypothetical protein
MYQFKTIDYGAMNFEALRNDLAINKATTLSREYKYTLAMIYPLQSIFNNFAIWREEKRLIAQCKFTIGQLTNLLNYFFDPTNKGISIRQQQNVTLYAPNIDDTATDVPFAPNIDDAVVSDAVGNPINQYYSQTIPATATYYRSFAPNINAGAVGSLVTIMIPSVIYNDSEILSKIVSVIEQIKITGINYTLKPY